MRAFAESDLRDVPAYQRPDALPAKSGSQMHPRIPRSRLVVIPGVGHMIDMEAAERFNAEVSAFLRAR